MADPAQGQVEKLKKPEIYVGPRPFERSERDLFFGRDREISELLSLVISSRVVLCYAPSGAGKTSLINAGLELRLDKEGFEVLPSARVGGQLPEGIDPKKVVNLYVFNALLSLAGKEGSPTDLTSCSLSEFLSTLSPQIDEEGFPKPRILIFDQFEELVTSYQERWQDREVFFQQVHDALQSDSLLRVIFVMREDFLARIEPFIRQLKPFSHTRFRLDLLGPDGALAAVNGPLRGTGKHFKEGVATALIEELRQVKVETAQGESVEVIGEYVEPVQLQVVCRNLWMSLPPDVQEISTEHLKAYGDVDQALRDFYESCLKEAKASLGANERIMREWFEGQLITPAGTRGIVFRDAARTADLPNRVVDFLENRHLIRGEWRAGSRWYELTHDRFIEPIQRANEAWRTRRKTRRNRVLGIIAGVLLFAMSLVSFNSTVAVSYTPNPTFVAAQTDISVSGATLTAVVNEQKAVVSKAQELAAQAIVQEDSDLALLLAIEANQRTDAPELRSSLHRIISKQGVVDGTFLREFDPKIISPRVIKRLDDHKGWVLSVAFSPDGKRFISGSATPEATVILWDVATAKPVGDPFTGHKGNILSVAFSPDSKLIASASEDGQILLWDAATGKPFGGTLLGHKGLVTSVAFSPDGQLLASGGEDGTVRIWSLRLMQPAAVFKLPSQVWNIAWSPDNKYLAVASANSTVYLLSIKASSSSDTDIRSLRGHRGIVRSMAWSPDGQTLASTSVSAEGSTPFGEVILWDVVTGEEITRPLDDNNQPVRTVAFDPTGTILAFGRDDGTIIFWDTRANKILGEPLKAHSHRVMSVAFSPDGRYMVSGSIDKTVVLWSLFGPAKSVAFSPRGNLLAASEGARISIWNPTDDSIPPLILYGHTDDVVSLQFSSDGNYLISSGSDRNVIVWYVSNGQEAVSLIQSNLVTSVAFSPDGKYIVSGSVDGAVRVWETVNGKPVAQMAHDAPVTSVAFSPDGKYVVAGSAGGTARVWEIVNGKEVARMAHDAPVTGVAFSPDGKYVVSGSFDRTARVWEAATGKEISRMSYTTPVISVAFSPDGRFVFSSSDQIATVWDPASGKEITSLSSPGTGITSVSPSIDSRTLAIGSEDASIFLWDLGLLSTEAETDPYIGIACSLAKRNFTLAEWQQYFPDEPYRITCPNLPAA